MRGVEVLRHLELDLDLLGASPVPRQQNQRMTTSPGFASDAVTGSGVIAGEASADSPADGIADGSTDAPVAADGSPLVAA